MRIGDGARDAGQRGTDVCGGRSVRVGRARTGLLRDGSYETGGQMTRRDQYQCGAGVVLMTGRGEARQAGDMRSEAEARRRDGTGEQRRAPESGEGKTNNDQQSKRNTTLNNPLIARMIT